MKVGAKQTLLIRSGQGFVLRFGGMNARNTVAAVDSAAPARHRHHQNDRVLAPAPTGSREDGGGMHRQRSGGALVDQRTVGLALGVPWKAARRVVEAAGFLVIDGGTARRWYVRKRDWLAFRRRLGLDVRTVVA